MDYKLLITSISNILKLDDSAEEKVALIVFEMANEKADASQKIMDIINNESILSIEDLYNFINAIIHSEYSAQEKFEAILLQIAGGDFLKVNLILSILKEDCEKEYLFDHLINIQDSIESIGGFYANEK